MGLRWRPWTKTGQEGSRIFSTEQRRIAIETFIRFDHSYADTVAELGYPNRHTLRNWWKEYEETGEVPVAKFEREPVASPLSASARLEKWRKPWN